MGHIRRKASQAGMLSRKQEQAIDVAILGSQEAEDELFYSMVMTVTTQRVGISIDAENDSTCDFDIHLGWV
jgi:hypothetical protein